jgi:NADPH:quinone reductase-like Zn-dependent oxidoreductase
MIPSVMKAVVQDKPGGALTIRQIPVPVPGKGEVLVRISHAPVNFSDMSLLQGTLADKPEYPIIPGIEASGVVVASGGGLIAGMRSGKKVACTASVRGNGTWAEYMVTSALKTVPLGKYVTEDQGSMLLVNPLTAMAFLEMALKGNHKSVVNNAAASSLGRMLSVLCDIHNIDLINIVRKPEQVDRLLGSGERYVLNSEDRDFTQNLSRLCEDLKADLLFDSVGGRQTTLLANAAPENSRIIAYAKLSEEDFTLDSRVLIQKHKTIEGFYLGKYSSERSVIRNLRTLAQVKKLMKNELLIKINKVFPLDAVSDAIELYMKDMSSGKVLLKP